MGFTVPRAGLRKRKKKERKRGRKPSKCRDCDMGHYQHGQRRFCRACGVVGVQKKIPNHTHMRTRALTRAHAHTAGLVCSFVPASIQTHAAVEAAARSAMGFTVPRAGLRKRKKKERKRGRKPSKRRDCDMGHYQHGQRRFCRTCGVVGVQKKNPQPRPHAHSRTHARTHTSLWATCRAHTRDMRRAQLRC
jgi:hypothetical protein